ncbi:barstar family protein [Verrucomicrobium sp. BvORR034]|uniref:barstar family protein n=1 Tax=Verrucomicrobium sp. BvORR034 TaxID=1396418 RepID=UPI000678C97A|nr:barstar family protein [Verrucomicrobium sp. BvORR034]
MHPAEITLDLSGCTNEDSLFDCLWDTFRFPPLYARSWFGLAENMFYDPEERMPEILKIRGFKILSQVDPISAGKLEAALAECLLDQDPPRKVLYEEEG